MSVCVLLPLPTFENVSTEREKERKKKKPEMFLLETTTTTRDGRNSFGIPGMRFRVVGPVGERPALHFPRVVFFFSFSFNNFVLIYYVNNPV